MKESVLLQQQLDELKAKYKKDVTDLQAEILLLKGDKPGKPHKPKLVSAEPAFSEEQKKAYEDRIAELTKTGEEKDLEIGDLKTAVGELESELEGARAAAKKGSAKKR